MGGLCCCPRTDEFDEYTYSHCTFFFHHFLSRYGTMFHRLEGRSAFPTPPANSLASTALTDVSENNSAVSLSTTPSFDADHRYSRAQRDGLVSRKSMPHFQQDSQPHLSASSLDLESFSFGAKGNENKLAYGLTHVQTSSDDEDVCPTCLEEYTTENPKITTRCSHHFHLGCIYEWLERSESCPVCGKEMDFCESP